MGSRRVPDVTKPELINNIDISIILMFVVQNTLNKTSKAPAGVALSERCVP